MDITAKEIFAVRDAAAAWFESLKPGTLFEGAMPAAKKAFPEDETAQRLFLTFALDALERFKEIVTTPENIIVRLEAR
jgi:hypothetical protein